MGLLGTIELPVNWVLLVMVAAGALSVQFLVNPVELVPLIAVANIGIGRIGLEVRWHREQQG